MSERYFNRDFSWLEFNQRVLHQALDSGYPLLERIRFLAIFSSNLDEFFMKRVGYLKRILPFGINKSALDGISPDQVLARIRERIIPMLAKLAECYQKELLPQLNEHGVHLLSWESLSPDEKKKMKAYFHAKVFPVLTPLAVDPAHPFPFISNLSVSLGVKLHHPKQANKLFARIKIPNVLPQMILASDESDKTSYRFVRLQDIIEANLSELFPEMVIEGVMPFRITRSIALEQIEDDVEDLLDLVEEELRLRRMAPVVRLEFRDVADPWMMDLLQKEIEIASEDVYQVAGELDYQILDIISNLNISALRFKSWLPVVAPVLADENVDIFRIIRQEDMLVHHPFESFSATVERFIRSATEDPDVLAIKMTLYRTGEDSVFIPLLIKAAEKGKQVVCIVELQARLDEANNILWGEMLENAGVHVAYGIVGLKTHAKLILVVRKEQDDFQKYAHIGTGNYNSDTAKLYTDLGLLTCNPKITSEIMEIFNYLTGLSLNKNYRKFLVAPINMRDRFMEMIYKEMELHREGKPGHIVAKMNSLEDHAFCDALYDASKEGVAVELIVRGFCCIKPGVSQLSENIRVKSVVGRFLEHSRIFYFRGGSPNPEGGKFFIGSADWMYRNLNNRVETIAPVEAKNLKKYLWDVLQLYITDNVQSWILQPDGSYLPPPVHPPDLEGAAIGCQEKLMRIAKIIAHSESEARSS